MTCCYMCTDHHTRLGNVLLFGFGVCAIAFDNDWIYCISFALQIEEEIYGNPKKFKLKDVIDFSISYWLLALSGLLYYITVYPFIGIAQTFLIQKYNFNTQWLIL